MKSITIPKVGTIPGPVVVAVGIGAAGFVGWRYYQSRQAAAAAAATGDTSGLNADFADGSNGSIPGILGAVPADGSFGSSGGDTGATGVGTSQPTTNAAWTQAATTFLQQSDTWSFTDITTALGNYLANKPTTPTQQAIIQAAIAAEGYPPVGTFTLISGGNTGLSMAPSGVKATPAETSISVAFSGVSGADHYAVHSGSAVVATGTGSPIEVTGLTAGTSYSLAVAAVTAAGIEGPMSAAVTVRTTTAPVAHVPLAKPATPTVSNVAGGGATAATGAVPNATAYEWYLNNTARGGTAGPSNHFTSLKPGTKYTVAVAAIGGSGTGPKSAARSFTAK